MKLIKKLMYLLLLLSILLGLLVLACAWKPGLAEQIAGVLYGNTYNEEAKDDTTGVSGVADTHDTGVINGADVSDSGADSDKAVAGTTDASHIPSQQSYIPPQREALVVPDEVKGKSDCEEITGLDSELADEEAKALEQGLDVGETGDGLTFDPLFYPYYEMLDENGQRIYRQIYANAKALNQAFAPVEPVQAGKLRDIFSAVYNDHPALFWLDTAYGCKHRSDGQCVEIDLVFNRTARNLEKENAVFLAAAKEILTGAEAFTTEYDKERFVHDTLIGKLDYSRSAEMNQSAYSALVNGRTVCAGYARAFQYLMQRLQIPCYYCSGYAGENHAWNIIRLEDGFYNVDVTWDDTDGGNNAYFNKTDEEYSDTHLRTELSVNLPPCNGEKYDVGQQEQQAEQEKSLRSSEELGFGQEELLYYLQEYYDDCTRNILEKGLGSYTFENVICGAGLLEQWETAYESKQYQEDYMVEAMKKLDARDCKISLTVEPLQDDRYLITHELRIQ